MNQLDDAARLAAVDRTGLLDRTASPAFDRAARLASALLSVPVAHTTLVLSDHQYYPSHVGLPEPIASERETTLDYSLCKHVVIGGAPFVVSDASAAPELIDNRAVAEFGVASYCGVPITSVEGEVIGALCGLGFETRVWSADEVALLQDLGEQLHTELVLRSELYARRDGREHRMILAMAAGELDRAAEELLAATESGSPKSVADMRDRLETSLSAIRSVTSRLANPPT